MPAGRSTRPATPLSDGLSPSITIYIAKSYLSGWA